LGGFQEGFIKVIYQLPIAGVVKTDPINPAKSGSEIENIKAGIFKFFIKIIVALYIVNISTYISK